MIKLDILVFGAHPDDIELGCGGTLIKESQKGKKIGIIDLTRGELGTRGNAAIRDKESKKAMEIMGVSIRENMNFEDGFFVNDKQHKLALIKRIRHYKPDIVITNALSDRHPDHPRACQIAIDACFLSGLEKIETDQQIWRPKSIYHYIQFNHLTADIVVDISMQMELKIEAVKAYKSQFYDPNSKESETIISTEDFLKSIEYRAKDLGRQSGCKFAEGFIVHKLPIVSSLLDLK